jgi:alanine dehydrogenase
LGGCDALVANHFGDEASPPQLTWPTALIAWRQLMVIGLPKEIKEQEYRVALLSLGAGYPDAQYEQAGAKLVNSPAAACQKQPSLVSGINVMNGKVTHKAVAGAHGFKAAKIDGIN